MFYLYLLLVLFPILTFCSPIKNSDDFSFWLLQYQNISVDELAKKFDVFEKEKPEIYTKKATFREGKKSKMVKPKEFAYSHELTRDKFFPMAAAAYGTEENIQQCLEKTFKNGQLHRHVQVNCNGYKNQICAAFLALSHSDKAIILSFRGTSSLMQLTIEALKILFGKRANAILGGKVASYFSEIYAQLAEKGLIEDALQLIKTNPDYEFWITGHSLGGALASLAASEIYLSKAIGADKIKLVTLGQPRTGNVEWATSLSRALPHYNYRVVNQRDIVAHLPPRLFQNYQHFMSEIWYISEMKNQEFVICDEMDEDDHNCSNSLKRLNSEYHLTYYGKIVSAYGMKGCAEVEEK